MIKGPGGYLRGDPQQAADHARVRGADHLAVGQASVCPGRGAVVPALELADQLGSTEITLPSN